MLLVATFLDPRFKSLHSIPRNSEKEALQKKVLQLTKACKAKHRESTGIDNQAAVPMQGVEDQKEDNEDEDDLFAAIERSIAAEEANTHNSDTAIGSVSQVCEDELKRCLAAPTLNLIHNPLEWWKCNQGLCPVLARLAKICVAVMATSAPSERVFSIASCLISNKRAGLGPEIAGKALFVAENWDAWESDLNFQVCLAED